MNFDPTPEQAAIVDFVGTKPDQSLMVSARAGSAKTTTILMASAAITKPFLVVAFNKKIADEIKPKLQSLGEAKTLNAMGHAAWAKARGGIKLKVDTDKMFKLVKEVIPQEDKDADEDLFFTTLALARKVKSSGMVPDGAPRSAKTIIPDHPRSWEDFFFELGMDENPLAVGYAREAVLRSITLAFRGEIDFDDQIYMSVFFGGDYPRYHTVIVDEAQDLSPMNHRQLKLMVGTRLIAVGDPYQAIYAFRGADSNSMTNMMDSWEFTQLGLTYSFRCPHIVAARQTHHVTDFKAWPTCAEGSVQSWRHKQWSLDSLPFEGAILCRNNAPLMKLAFTLIRNRRPVNILGRDIGANLAGILDRVCAKRDLPVDEAIVKLEAWKERELLKVANSESKTEGIHDRFECLMVLLEASGAATSKACISFIKELFVDKADGLVLASGHRSKGLEWDWVLHLDPFRVPSRQAQRAEDQGNPMPMMQENNLRYVIETRTKAVLVEANLDDCLELEGAKA